MVIVLMCEAICKLTHLPLSTATPTVLLGVAMLATKLHWRAWGSHLEKKWCQQLLNSAHKTWLMWTCQNVTKSDEICSASRDCLFTAYFSSSISFHQQCPHACWQSTETTVRKLLFELLSLEDTFPFELSCGIRSKYLTIFKNKTIYMARYYRR